MDAIQIFGTKYYGMKLWSWEEKSELKKIILDYVRWIFKLDFCPKVCNYEGAGNG